MTIETHGMGGYRQGCRCDVCREANRSYHQAYYVAKDAEWRAKDKEHSLEYYAAWYERNREHTLEVRRKYYTEHREYYAERGAVWYAEHKEQAKAKSAASYVKNKELRRESRRRRFALKRGATGGYHTEAEWKLKLAWYGGACAYCDVVEKITRDHIQPLSKGGSDLIGNIQPLCHSCNSRKGTKW